MDDGKLDSVAPSTTRSFDHHSHHDGIQENANSTSDEIDNPSEDSDFSTRYAGGSSDDGNMDDDDSEYTGNLEQHNMEGLTAMIGP